jgi:hypothetical protein
MQFTQDYKFGAASVIAQQKPTQTPQSLAHPQKDYRTERGFVIASPHDTQFP